jgi:CDGSH-type Zn-finger protein/uncharacterized Fe-S cluster protein YjdI
MKDKTHEFQAPGITVAWSRTRCIHAAECVFGLPLVFQPGERPWVKAEAATPDAIAAVIRRCPTGALHYSRSDGAAEVAPEENTIVASRHGPLYLKGEVELRTESGEVLLRDTRVALCRCGASGNAPLCDGSHHAIRFHDPGGVFEGALEPAPRVERTLVVTAGEGQPLRVTGPFALMSASGRVRLVGGAVSLCRCGASRNRPFRDGSHKQLA